MAQTGQILSAMNSIPMVAVTKRPPASIVDAIAASDSLAPATQILFESEFIALVLVKLACGQRLYFDNPALRLLTVVEGRLRMRGPDGSFVLQETGRWRLESGTCWKIRAMADATVSLLVVKPRSDTTCRLGQNVRLRLGGGRCAPAAIC